MSSSAEQKQPSEYQDNLQILMEIPFFAGLPLEALKLIAYFCKRETFNPGEYLFRQNEVDNNAYYIIAGTGALVLEDQPEKPPLNMIHQGDFIGGLSLLGDMKRLFSLKAEEKIVCIVLARKKFRKTLEQFPNITNKIMESLVDSVYQWEMRFLRHLGEADPVATVDIGVSLI
jgi:CRP/FNR family cyclic AMP-dependent transcriptional regulator